MSPFWWLFLLLLSFAEWQKLPSCEVKSDLCRRRSETLVFWPSNSITHHLFYFTDSFGNGANWTESPEETLHNASLAIQNIIEYIGNRIDFFGCARLFRSEIQFCEKWNRLTVVLDFLLKDYNDWVFYKWLWNGFHCLKWYWTSLFILSHPVCLN